MTRKLFKIDDIVDFLEKKVGNEIVGFCVVVTEGYDLTTNPKGRNSKKERSSWADVVVKELFEPKERSEIVKKYPRKQSTGEYNFSYIKFAADKSGEIFGIVNGKSSFHCMYPSDVWFYSFDVNNKKELADYFEKHDLRWYTEKIIIVKNRNNFDCKEAYENEKKLRQWFNTFD